MPVTTSEPKFHCSTCGKEYRWKPELAGKKAKCKCGTVISIPTAPPAPKAAEPEADLDSLYALAQEEKKATRAAPVASAGYRCPSCSAEMAAGSAVCTNCGLDIRTGMGAVGLAGAGAGAAPRGGVMAAAGAYVAANASGRGAGVIPYGGGPTTRSRSDQDMIYEGGKAISLYLPLGLIVLGVLFYIGQVAFSSNRVTTAMLVMLVGMRIVMDSLLILTSLLIAVRGFDMGFGALGPGLLKILAIAMAPGALGQMVGGWVGGGFGGLFVGGLLTIILYYTLIKVLFNLDLGETFLLVFLIYGVQNVLGAFLIVTLTGLVSSGALDSDAAVAVGGGALIVSNATADQPQYPPKVALTKADIAEILDKRSLAVLRSFKGGADEAKTFVESHELHTFANMDKTKTMAFIKELEDLGCKDIRRIGTVVLKTKDGMPYANVASIMFELPDDPTARKKLFDIRADLMKSLKQREEMVVVESGGAPDEPKKQEALKDWGQKYMSLDFTGSRGAGPTIVGEDGDEEDIDAEGEDMEEEADMDEADVAEPPTNAPSGATPAKTPATPDESGTAEPAPAGDAPF